MSTSGGYAAVLRSFFFKQKTAYEIGVRLVGSEMCIRDRFLGLFSKDDIHSWTGAHELKVSCPFQGGMQLLLGLFSKDDIHIWTGAHDLKMSGQFQGVCSCSSGFFKR